MNALRTANAQWGSTLADTLESVLLGDNKRKKYTIYTKDRSMVVTEFYADCSEVIDGTTYFYVNGNECYSYDNSMCMHEVH